MASRQPDRVARRLSPLRVPHEPRLLPLLVGRVDPLGVTRIPNHGTVDEDVAQVRPLVEVAHAELLDLPALELAGDAATDRDGDAADSAAV